MTHFLKNRLNAPTVPRYQINSRPISNPVKSGLVAIVSTAVSYGAIRIGLNVEYDGLTYLASHVAAFSVPISLVSCVETAYGVVRNMMTYDSSNTISRK